MKFNEIKKKKKIEICQYFIGYFEFEMNMIIAIILD